VTPDYRESDIRYLTVIVTDPDPVMTATEIADELGISQQAAHRKLSDMEERGLLKSKKTGARSRVYWPTTDGLDAYGDS